MLVTAFILVHSFKDAPRYIQSQNSFINQANAKCFFLPNEEYTRLSFFKKIILTTNCCYNKNAALQTQNMLRVAVHVESPYFCLVAPLARRLERRGWFEYYVLFGGGDWLFRRNFLRATYWDFRTLLMLLLLLLLLVVDAARLHLRHQYFQYFLLLRQK